MKKILALILTLVMVAACFAGCSASQSTEQGQQAQSKGLIVVGYTIYKPMNYLDDNNTLVGFDTELAEKVFTALGYQVKFKEIEWSAKYTDLDSGNIDCVWNGFTCNSTDDDGVARKDKVDFSYNYMENRQIVVVKKGSGIAAMADLEGKRAVVEDGSAGQSFAETIEGASVKGAVKQTDCLMEIMSGTADFAVVDSLLAASYVGVGDYADLEIVDALSGDIEYYAIGFKKGNDLKNQVNAQLEKCAEDGTIKQLAEKYKVSATVITDYASQK